jgi:hypothetical protein
MLRVIQSSIPTRSVYYAALLLTLFITACTQDAGTLSLPHFAPRMPYPSPFEAQKVILSATTAQLFSRNGGGSDTNAGNGQPLVVSVILSNSGAKADCDQKADSVACFFAHHPEKKDSIDVQYYAFPLPKEMTPERLVQWADRDFIIGVTEDSRYQTLGYSDTLYTANQKAYLDTIGLEASQPTFTETALAPVKVAIIDTGVAAHPDLGNAADLPGVLYREDIRSLSSKNSPECNVAPYAGRTYSATTPLNPHGTFVAGIIAGTPNNALGVTGIARNAQILAFTVGDCRGRISTSEIGNALSAALAQSAEVVNLSLGGATADDPGIRLGIVSLLNRKALIVAASGNDFKDLRQFPTYPAVYSANYPGFITVGWGTATGDLERGNQTTVGSSYSPTHVKILAPGTSIVSTLSPADYPVVASGYGRSQGSSFATPMVTAAAAIAVGFLKRNALLYDERMVEYLILEKGARFNAALNPFIRNGAVLDLSLLATTLRLLKDSGNSPGPVTITGQSVAYNTALRQPIASFTATWNVPVTHYGARLGIFDGACGFSKPCLIQDFELLGSSGTKSVSLSRNELLPMLPSPSDPDFAINVKVGVYYVIIDPETGKPKNNFGLDALTAINIRDFDMSNASSPFLGEVVNIRTDMTHLYVQGWSCLAGSNQAVLVELVETGGEAIPSSYSFTYPWMFPHSGVMDGLGYRGGPFLVEDMKLSFRDRTQYRSGLEANPAMLTLCNTLTAAHGFEFAVPFDTLLQRNLIGKTFSVRATRPRAPVTTVFLKDSFSNSAFVIPEVNFQKQLPHGVTLARSGANVTLGGHFCSNSPTPIHVELSFSNWDLSCRLKQAADFPSFNAACDLGSGAPLPPLFNPAQPDRNLVTSYWSTSTAHRSDTIDMEMTATELSRHILRYPVRWPNAFVGIENNFTVGGTTFNAFVSNQGLRDIVSNGAVGGFFRDYVTYGVEGNLVPSQNAALYSDRSAISRIGNDFRMMDAFWDWYNVGEPYTDSVVAYSSDPTKPVGDFLMTNYRISKFMRETKPFATPLGGASQVLGHVILKNPVPGGAACPYQFPVTHTISNLLGYAPNVAGSVSAFLFVSETRPALPTIDNVAASMRTVPIDMRFFQDGVLIKHLLSNFGTSLTTVETLGRGN